MKSKLVFSDIQPDMSTKLYINRKGENLYISNCYGNVSYIFSDYMGRMNPTFTRRPNMTEKLIRYKLQPFRQYVAVRLRQWRNSGG